MLALAGALWGQRLVGPGVVWARGGGGFTPEYAAVLAAYGWFLALSFAMLWRARPRSWRRVRPAG